ncbi:hypothetical protein [Zhongshania aliphaticivorans]|uniref:hypothetical protein n=1 Tax=Zhongshania aliphaticivorans TaxID=1470434 RepID=UPI0012E63A03|nr:hypothetical protein [Zhongshania aliphaticivorans]CAA0078290.1 Uncharacterised protein [Zhongshania aliphaticivorans]
MSHCFAFRFVEPDDQQRKSLAIFTETKVSLDAISRTLKHDVTENLVPKNVYLITTSQDGYTRQGCRDDAAFISEFGSYVGEIDERLRCLVSSSSGFFNYCDGQVVKDELSASILQSGMLALFKKHNGLIVSNTAYHFVKPSGAHCDKFIRASNLLVSSGEVAFLAISLLPYFKSELKRIYVDTSSIAFLVSIAIRLYSDFTFGPPAIESFESYAALNHPYDFVEDSSSLVLISATTSGSLTASLLGETNLPNNQIVTLFHINLPPEQIGVFDVSNAIEEGLISTKSSHCEFCKRGSKPIRIAGDQFLPENPKHELLVIKKRDFSSRRENFFGQFAALRVLQWNRLGSTGDGAKEHFYIDVEAVIASKSVTFVENLDKVAKRYISRDLKTVITLDDTGSQALCDAIKPYIGSEPEGPTFIAASSLSQTDLTDTGSVMVIAGAITSGRSLLAVARKLRCIHSSSTIIYFVGFSKLPSHEAKVQLEKDLSQGGHELVILNTCSVPRIKEHSETAWDRERKILTSASEDDPLGDTYASLPASLESRRKGVIADSLDSDELFLRDAQGDPLKLRRTFAFWSDLGFDDARLSQTTQADVYWTIQCVLHDLRTKSENGGLATAYHTTLISPANFDRYNDGVIQASLLRAAHPVELDYRVDPVFSRQMADVCMSVIRNWDDEQGEAALEFLMALWSGRLQLLDEHINELSQCRTDDMAEDIKFFLDRLSVKIA